MHVEHGMNTELSRDMLKMKKAVVQSIQERYWGEYTGRIVSG
jgi:hypothetical protein